MPTMYFNYPQDSACPFHRLLMPARFCGPAFKEYGWTIECGEGLPPGKDVYVFHGLPNEVAVFEAAKLKRKGARFVWSVDDDWTTIPDWNPARPGDQGLAIYDIMVNLADFILTSTPALAATFDRPGVLCAPNLIDSAAFPAPPKVTENDGSTRYDFKVELPIRVTWVGGGTHKGDVEVLVEPLARLLDKHGPGRVALIFQGLAPPPALLGRYLHRGLYHQPPVPFASYQKIVNSIKPDVYLGPLAKIPFNLSKSNLRLMEGWMLCAPPVATPWGEYGCIRSGEDGRVADSPEEWYSALNRLVTDHEYRLGMAARGRDRAEAEYDWNNPACRKPWYEAIARILGTPVPTPAAESVATAA